MEKVHWLESLNYDGQWKFEDAGAAGKLRGLEEFCEEEGGGEGRGAIAAG